MLLLNYKMKLTIEKCWKWSDWPTHWGLSPQACPYVPIKASSPTVKCCMSLARIYVVIFRLGQQKQCQSRVRPRPRWRSLSNSDDELPCDWLPSPVLQFSLGPHLDWEDRLSHPMNRWFSWLTLGTYQRTFQRASAYKMCIHLRVDFVGQFINSEKEVIEKGWITYRASIWSVQVLLAYRVCFVFKPNIEFAESNVQLQLNVL